MTLKIVILLRSTIDLYYELLSNLVLQSEDTGICRRHYICCCLSHKVQEAGRRNGDIWEVKEWSMPVVALSGLIRDGGDGLGRGRYVGTLFFLGREKPQVVLDSFHPTGGLLECFRLQLDAANITCDFKAVTSFAVILRVRHTRQFLQVHLQVISTATHNDQHMIRRQNTKAGGWVGLWFLLNHFRERNLEKRRKDANEIRHEQQPRNQT